MPKTTLDQWRTLQAVVDHGGFAQASTKLHRSQSAVSYTVAKLQETLGLELLRIDGRKAQLTEVGSVLLQRSRQLTSEAAELEQLANNLASGWEAEIHLVVDEAYPADVLMQTLKTFEPVSQGTRVLLKEVVMSGGEDALRQQQADLVITGIIPANYLGNKLLEIEFIAVAHPDHPLHQLQRELTLNDLEKHMQVVISDSGVTNPRDFGWLDAKQRWSVTNMNTALMVITHGLGFGWLPEHQIRKSLRQGIIKPLPMREGQSYFAHMYLIYGNADQAGPATRQLAALFLNNTAP
jgi:DNA-binding transcriptional LysR family regulator